MSSWLSKLFCLLFLSSILVNYSCANFAIGRLSPNRPSAGKRSLRTESLWKSIFLQSDEECSIIKRLLLREEIDRLQEQLSQMTDILDQCHQIVE